MKVIHVGKENFDKEVIRAEGKVLLDFYASWCGPCRMLAPILDEIAEEREDIKVCKINVDEEAELASGFGVMSIPTLVVMERGKVKSESLGARPKAEILEMLG